MIVAVMTKILFEALAVGQNVEPFDDLVLPLFSSSVIIYMRGSTSDKACLLCWRCGAPHAAAVLWWSVAIACRAVLAPW